MYSRLSLNGGGPDENSTFAGLSRPGEQMQNVRSRQGALGSTRLSGKRCQSQPSRQFPGRISKKSMDPGQEYLNSDDSHTITGAKPNFSVRNEKNRLHSFFCGGRIRDGSGIRRYGALLSSKKAPGLPWGVVK
jgi:hypothetical protein